MADVLVLGTGLIGTSLGLALAGRRDVCLHDADPDQLRIAVGRGAGRAWDGREAAALVVVAAPPRTTGRLLSKAMRLGLGQTYTHTASVQSQVQREVETAVGMTSRLVGGHPMAGREVSGAEAGLGDLFAGRRWAVCPGPTSAPDAVAAVEDLARSCGADPVRVPVEEHDAAVALVSHLPHLASAVLAGLLDEGQDLRLAGPGLADATRLAAGDPQLWVEVLGLNAERVAPLAALLAHRLDEAARVLAGTDARPAPGTEPGGATASVDEPAGGGPAPQGDPESQSEALRQLLERGRRGRARVPLKRGEVQTGFGDVAVVLKDRPGELARVLAAVASAEVNVEDVRVEHAAGSPTGLARLSVRLPELAATTEALRSGGWQIHTEASH